VCNDDGEDDVYRVAQKFVHCFVRLNFIIIIIIIIIIHNFHSAIMPLGGYRGAGGTGTVGRIISRKQ